MKQNHFCALGTREKSEKKKEKTPSKQWVGVHTHDLLKYISSSDYVHLFMYLYLPFKSQPYEQDEGEWKVLKYAQINTLLYSNVLDT